VRNALATCLITDSCQPCCWLDGFLKRTDQGVQPGVRERTVDKGGYIELALLDAFKKDDHAAYLARQQSAFDKVVTAPPQELLPENSKATWTSAATPQ
jgi:hypothetical protein